MCDLKFITFKIKNRKLLFILLALIVLFIVLIDFPGRNTNEFTVPDNSSRVSFIKNLGIDISEEIIEEKPFKIPENFTKVFLKYNELQKEAGYDLIKYSGQTATIYKYKAINMSDSIIYVNLIVLNDKIIGGDISSVELDGFMLPLKEFKIENW